MSKILSRDETIKLRKELMQKRDTAWLATIRLPKTVGLITNFLALLVILIILTVFFVILFQY